MNNTFKRIINIMIVLVAVVLIFQFLIWLLPIILVIIAIILIVSALNGNKKKSKTQNYEEKLHEREERNNDFEESLNGDIIDIDYEDIDKK